MPRCAIVTLPSPLSHSPAGILWCLPHNMHPAGRGVRDSFWLCAANPCAALHRAAGAPCLCPPSASSCQRPVSRRLMIFHRCVPAHERHVFLDQRLQMPYSLCIMFVPKTNLTRASFPLCLFRFDSALKFVARARLPLLPPHSGPKPHSLAACCHLLHTSFPGSLLASLRRKQCEQTKRASKIAPLDARQDAAVRQHVPCTVARSGHRGRQPALSLEPT